LATVAEQGRERQQQRSATRVPPHNLAAEASLLGALLLSRDAISAVAELHVGASDFYKPAHQHVFEAIRVLAAVGEPVDAVTVADELRRHDLLDAIGGTALLADLQAATPAISNAPRYARIVQDTAMLRRLINVAGEIAEIGYDEPDDVTKALDVAESKVFELADRRVVDSTKPIGDLLNLAISDLEQAYERGTALTGVPTGYTDLDELLNGLQPSTLNVVGARPSMGKCVAWDTELVDPATGELVTAAELHRRGTSGEWVQVVSLDPATGRLIVATPSAFVDDGVKPVYRVRTRLGRVVRTTLSHPFLTESGWRPLGQLAKGDRIAAPRALAWFGSERLTPNEAALLAHLLGDAGLRSRMVDRKDDVVSRCGALELDVVPMLRRCGIWNLDDHELRLPPVVFRLEQASLEAFLDRLLVENRGSRPAHLAQDAFAARSERLARDVQHLLLRLGTVTELRPESILRRGEREVVHVLSVVPVRTKEPQPVLVASAGAAASPRPPGRGVEAVPGSDICWDEIVAIDYDGDEQVYDLTVPGHHNFVAADLVVHNTAFALGMASHVAVEAAQPVLFFSLEMGHKELTQRILSSEARVDSAKMRTGKLTEQDWSKIGKAIGRLEAPLFIDDNPNVTVMEIRAKARRMKARHGGLGLVVVDYLQLMSGRATAENRQVEVSEISRGLKILARELEVPIVALSQLSRNLEARADKKPMLADLRESGSIEQDADVVMFIYRDEVYNADTQDRGVAEIIVSKHRNGPIGTRRLVFLAPYTRFDNAARGL
jgi:replicative DNA helicase